MKTIVMIVVALLTINLSLAQEGEKLSPTVEFMKLMNVEDTMVNASQLSFRSFLKKLRTKGMAEAGVQEVKEVSDVYFRKIVSDPDFKKELAGLYEEKFTTNEMKGLVEFYKSPLGQKSLQLLPEMTNAGTKLGEKYAQKYVAGFREQLTPFLKKYPTK